MRELIARLARRPGLTVLLLLASFAISLLMLAPPVFVMQVLNRYVAFGVDGTLIALATGAGFAALMEFLLRWARLRLAASVSVAPDDRLAAGVGQALAGSKLAFAEAVKTEQKRRCLLDLSLIQSAYAAPSLASALDLPFTAILFLALFVIDPVLAAIAGGVGIALFLAALVRLAATQAAIRSQKMGARPGLGPAQEDLLAAPAVLRGFNAAALAVRNWRMTARLQQAMDRRFAAGQGQHQAMTQAATAVTTIAVIGVGAVLVVQQKIDVGVLIAANILAARAVGGVAGAVGLSVTFGRAREALNRLQTLTAQPMESADRKTLDAYTGRIDFEDVTFAHAGDVKPLVEHLSFSLGAGEVLVIHGSNGAGKTSLAEVVLGLRDPLRGTVLADGIDLRQVSPSWWRTQVCYLPQDTKLLNVSIADNLRVLNPDLDDAALNRAIQAAGARDLVARLPDGLDTVIEDHGDRLAAGERKRLALARALTGQGKLVLFDEPLEGLDAAGKASVAALLQSFAASGRTIVVCASDPDLIRQADWRLDLDSKPTPALEKGPGRQGVVGTVAPVPQSG